MTRELLTFMNASEHGEGMEGLINWVNVSSGNWFIPLFLVVFYILSIYVASKSEYKLGGWVLLLSLAFFILAMILQTVTQFNQMVIFAFGIGIIVGVVMTFVENS